MVHPEVIEETTKEGQVSRDQQRLKATMSLSPHYVSTTSAETEVSF